MTSPTHKSEQTRRVRRTPLAARGEPMVWLTGACLSVCLLMIVGLLAAVVVQGSVTFWQPRIHKFTLADGATIMGVPVREEAYDAAGDELIALRALIASGAVPEGSLDAEGRPLRRLYRVGNREVYGEPFRWVSLYNVRNFETPARATMLERREWGVWVGMPMAVVREDLRPAPAEGETFEAEGVSDEDGARIERSIVQTRDGPRLRERVFVAEGPDDALSTLQRLLPAARERWDRVYRLNEHAIGDVNHHIESERLRHREVELRHAEGRVSDTALAASKERHDARLEALNLEYRRIESEVAEIDAEDARWRFVIVEPTQGRFAPLRQTEPDEFMRLSQIVRAVPANDLDLAGRLGVYFSRWGEFLGGQPREANTAGGVFPVIFCTVLLTILLSIIVVPLGVIAALYLREYAKQGFIVSAVRIAVNNLAGVPSIVYGVFGLGFFCYTLGRYIDAGPTVTWAKSSWVFGMVGLIALTAMAVVAGYLARPVPGQPPSRRAKIMMYSGGLLWLGAAGLIVALFARSPFFHGFYRANLPNPTFGTKGLLWSALTLALLTLPVVIVATEEAISAVPRTLREGSYGCGASKWQTIQRIVLPRAAPGIMTGMILAMARGAGEVAPLMLVGAVKLAPELPFSTRFPFIHVERSFMHLGFHIYDVGFQSPDSEASRPLAWTTTLLLIVIVAVLNLTAISLRARLRRRFVTGAF